MCRFIQRNPHFDGGSSALPDEGLTLVKCRSWQISGRADNHNKEPPYLLLPMSIAP
jgi:hypothetical protein